MSKLTKLVRNPVGFVRDSAIVRRIGLSTPSSTAVRSSKAKKKPSVSAPTIDEGVRLMSNLLLEAEPEVFKKAWLVAVRGATDRRVLESLYALRAESEICEGNHEEARKIAHTLIDAQKSPLGHYYLASSYFLFGEYDRAIRELMLLLHLEPGHADGSYLLAEALGEVGDREAAWQVLESIATRSKRVKTWHAMANLVESPGDYLRFMRSYGAWKAAKGTAKFDRNASEYHALAALRCGNYPLARKVWQESLLHVASSPGGFDALKTKKVNYSAGRAERALVDLHTLLESVGIDMFLVSGTLLGCVREGRLLSHDKDVDVGVWDEIDKPMLMEAIKKSGLFYVLASRSPDIVRIKHVSGIGIDVFYHQRHADDYAHGGVKMVWHNSPFALEKRRFLGHDFLIPANYDLYLTENYGDWRTPKIDFDTVYDTPNGEVTNEDEIAIHVYKMLMEALIKGAHERVQFYLHELRSMGDGDFVDTFASSSAVELLPTPTSDVPPTGDSDAPYASSLRASSNGVERPTQH